MSRIFIASLLTAVVSVAAFSLPASAGPISGIATSPAASAEHQAKKGMVVKVRDWRRGRGWRGRNRGYRRWRKRRHYGNVIGGIVLGAIIAGAARNAYRPDDDDTCWYWTDRRRTHGYWDYCDY